MGSPAYSIYSNEYRYTRRKHTKPKYLEQFVDLLMEMNFKKMILSISQLTAAIEQLMLPKYMKIATRNMKKQCLVMIP